MILNTAAREAYAKAIKLDTAIDARVIRADGTVTESTPAEFEGLKDASERAWADYREAKDAMTHTVEVVEYAHPEFRLIHGHCTQPGCQGWATRYLLDENGKRVPSGKVCRKCAGEIIREYRAKLGLNWQAHPIIMYHVGHRLFDTKDHADEYVAQKDEKQL